MTRIILAICGIRHEAGWHVKRYAYIDPEQEHEKVPDNRLGLYLMEKFVGGEIQWELGEQPKETDTRFFDIYIDVSNCSHIDARYDVDYHKYDGCPSQAIKDGMIIYEAIKKYGTRPANEQERKNREILKDEQAKRMAAINAEAQEPRFRTGRNYRYTAEDRFGHIVQHKITVMSDSTNTTGERIIEYVIDERLGCKTFARARRYDNGDGEYISGYDIKVRAKDEA